MDDDEELTDEELAEVIEEETQEQPVATIKSKVGSAIQSAGNYAQGAKERFEQIRMQQELKRQAREAQELQNTEKQLEQAEKRARLAALKQRVRQYNEQASPKQGNLQRIVSNLTKNPPQQGGGIFTPQQSSGGFLLSNGPSGGTPSWLSNGGGRTPSWLSGGRGNTSGSFLFGTPAPRTAVRRVKRAKKAKRRRR